MYANYAMVQYLSISDAHKNLKTLHLEQQNLIQTAELKESVINIYYKLIFIYTFQLQRVAYTAIISGFSRSPPTGS